MRAIILAGGFGTRLRSIIGDSIPKCMALINGKPIVEHIIEDLRTQGITDITLCLHYKAEVVMKYFGDSVKYRIEIDEPLGTGGAIKNCIDGDEPVLVMNGDTLAKINYIHMMYSRKFPLSIATTRDGVSAGIYSINPRIFDGHDGAFSFEEDIVPNTPHEFYTIESFIDIGTPEGYEKAQV